MNAISLLFALALALTTFGHAAAQAPPPPQKAVAAPGFDVLKGAWVRPDGGYMIASSVFLRSVTSMQPG